MMATKVIIFGRTSRRPGCDAGRPLRRHHGGQRWLAARHRVGGGSGSLTPLNNDFFVARRLVAAALPARDPAAVVPFNRGGFHAAVLSWTDRDTTWAEANCGVGVVPPPATVPIVAVLAVP